MLKYIIFVVVIGILSFLLLSSKKKLKKRIHCFFQSATWLVLSGIGLLMPVVLYYLEQLFSFRLNSDFTLINFLFTEKGIIVYSLTIITIIFLMYKEKFTLCRSKKMKDFCLYGFMALLVCGLIVFDHIISGNEPEYCKTNSFIFINICYCAGCVSYSFLIKYHLYYLFKVTL